MSRITTGQSRVTVDNWQEPTNLSWSFLHMDELFANAAIRAAVTDSAGPLHRAGPGDPLGLRDVAVRLPDGSDSTVGQILSDTSTDLLMSVSKSIVSTVVGVLAAQGKIDTARPIEDYVPELHACGYTGATVRDILDMRSGIRFSEEYLEPGSEVRKLDEAVGWAPETAEQARSRSSY